MQMIQFKFSLTVHCNLKFFHTSENFVLFREQLYKVTHIGRYCFMRTILGYCCFMLSAQLWEKLLAKKVVLQTQKNTQNIRFMKMDCYPGKYTIQEFRFFFLYGGFYLCKQRLYCLYTLDVPKMLLVMQMLKLGNILLMRFRLSLSATNVVINNVYILI